MILFINLVMSYKFNKILDIKQHGCSIGKPENDYRRVLYTNPFGGIFSATSLAIGIDSSILNINANSTDNQVKQTLLDNYDKIDHNSTIYNKNRFSISCGYSRSNAKSALEISKGRM